MILRAFGHRALSHAHRACHGLGESTCHGMERRGMDAGAEGKCPCDFFIALWYASPATMTQKPHIGCQGWYPTQHS